MRDYWYEQLHLKGYSTLNSTYQWDVFLIEVIESERAWIGAELPNRAMNFDWTLNSRPRHWRQEEGETRNRTLAYLASLHSRSGIFSLCKQGGRWDPYTIWAYAFGCGGQGIPERERVSALSHEPSTSSLLTSASSFELWYSHCAAA